MNTIDEAGRLAAIEYAATTLRRILCRADHGRPETTEEITIDHERGELHIGSGLLAISLDRLLSELAHVPTPQWINRIDDFVETAVASGIETAGLRLQHWPDVENRLMVRLSSEDRAGPLAIPIGHRLAIDVGIDLQNAITVPTRSQIASWGRTTSAIRDRAAANTRQNLKPERRVSDVTDNIGLTTFTGSPWVTGAIAALDQLLPPPGPPAHGGARSGPVDLPRRRYVSMFAPDTLAVFEPFSRPAMRSSGPAGAGGSRSALAIVSMTVQWFDHCRGLSTDTVEPHRLDHPIGFNLFAVGRWPDVQPVPLPSICT